jgi:hypothetical protein
MAERHYRIDHGPLLLGVLTSTPAVARRAERLLGELAFLIFNRRRRRPLFIPIGAEELGELTEAGAESFTLDAGEIRNEEAFWADLIAAASAEQMGKS